MRTGEQQTICEMVEKEGFKSSVSRDFQMIIYDHTLTSLPWPNSKGQNVLLKEVRGCYLESSLHPVNVHHANRHHPAAQGLLSTLQPRV